MLWFVVRRVDNDEELARINSSIHAAKLARQKANEYEVEVKVKVEEHEEDEAQANEG